MKPAARAKTPSAPKQHLATLAKRLQEVVDRKLVDSMGAWSELAGLSRGYVEAQIRKGREGELLNPEAGKIQLLAAAAGVSPAWLAGWSDDPGPFVQVAEPEELTPRDHAIEAARHLGIEDGAVAAVLASGAEPLEDTAEAWLLSIREMAEHLERARNRKAASIPTLTSMAAAQPKRPSEPPPNASPPHNRQSLPASSKTRRKSGGGG